MQKLLNSCLTTLCGLFVLMILLNLLRHQSAQSPHRKNETRPTSVKPNQEAK